jgi:dipeptidyl aminopeptidase/acylaminoacyl peptidase
MSLLGVEGEAQPRQPLTPEGIVGLSQPSDLQLSVDGRRVVFVQHRWEPAEDRYQSDLWMVNDGRELTRLTSHPGRDDQPRWSPDGRRLAFLSDRETPGNRQIFLLQGQMGGDPFALTRHPVSIEQFEWAPNGQYLAFLAAAPSEDGAALPRVLPPIVIDGEDRPHQLWLVEVGTGRILPLTRGKHHLVSFQWSPDSSRIVCTARPDSGLLAASKTEIYLMEALTPQGVPPPPRGLPEVPRLTDGGGAERDPRFSPNGRWISYLARPDGDSEVGPDRLHLIPANPITDLRSTENRPVPLLLPESFEGYIRSHQWVFDSQRIVFQAGQGVFEQLYSVHLGDRKPFLLTRTDGASTGFSVSPDGLTIAFLHENPRLATEIAYLSARIMVPIFLTELNPQASHLLLGQVETVRWPSRDGTLIEGLLVYPIGYQTGQRYPLITSLHGGPESAYVRGFLSNWSTFPQLYAAAGYAVFLPNYRGSSHYGPAFAKANSGHAGEVEMDDILSGIDHLVERGIVDGDRLGLTGWSYGGYLSALLVGRTNRFQAAVWGAGLVNAISYWGTADMVAQRERLHGGPPTAPEAARRYESQSPLSGLAQTRTPTLLFHGEKDARVPLTQSQEAYRRLRRSGVNAQMVVYPNEGHALTVPSYQLDKMKRELAWMVRHLPAGPLAAGR